MECFDNLIAIKGICDEQTPKSNIYLDDVGLHKSDLEAFAGKEYSGVEDYFTNRLNFAVKSMASEIHNHFRNKYLSTSLVQAHVLGYYDQALATVLGANYRGINMDFNQSEATFSVSVSEISLFLNHTGTVNVLVYDLNQDKLLDTIQVACTSGKIATVYPHKTYYSALKPMNLFFGYDSDGITAIKTPIKSGLCCGKISCVNSYMNAKGVEVDGSFIKANIENLNHTAGMQLTYDLKCDNESWLCSHATAFALPLAYKCAEIMVSDALLNTSGERATNHHTINKEELEQRYTFFRSKYTESFGNILENMELPKNKCFRCNTNTRHVIALP